MEPVTKERLARYFQQVLLEKQSRTPIRENKGQPMDIRPIPLIKQARDLIQERSHERGINANAPTNVPTPRQRQCCESPNSSG